jgi:hypothetical protein
MITDLNPVEMDNGTVTLLSRMSGKTMIYFDVTLDKNGNGITGKDLLFTNAHTFTGFNDTGIHVTDKDSISTIEAVHLEHLLYAYNYGYIDDEDYHTGAPIVRHDSHKCDTCMGQGYIEKKIKEVWE